MPVKMQRARGQTGRAAMRPRFSCLSVFLFPSTQLEKDLIRCDYFDYNYHNRQLPPPHKVTMNWLRVASALCLVLGTVLVDAAPLPVIGGGSGDGPVPESRFAGRSYPDPTTNTRTTTTHATGEDGLYVGGNAPAKTKYDRARFLELVDDTGRRHNVVNDRRRDGDAIAAFYGGVDAGDNNTYGDYYDNVGGVDYPVVPRNARPPLDTPRRTNGRTIRSLASDSNSGSMHDYQVIPLSARERQRQMATRSDALEAYGQANEAAGELTVMHTNPLLNFGRGAVDGVVETAQGIVQVVTHPVRTAEAVGHALAHPAQTAVAYGRHVRDQTQQQGLSYVLGGFGVDAAMIAVPGALGAKAAAKAGATLENTADISRVAAGASTATASMPGRFARKWLPESMRGSTVTGATADTAAATGADTLTSGSVGGVLRDLHVQQKLAMAAAKQAHYARIGGWQAGAVPATAATGLGTAGSSTIRGTGTGTGTGAVGETYPGYYLDE